MSKRLICLFLSLVLFMGILTGCANKTDEKAAADIAGKASEAAKTISMYLMSESAVSAETVAKIEDAVNRVTEAKFKTRVKLYYYTEAEYYAKLDAAFAARDEAKANGTLSSNKVDENTEEETIVNEYGVVEIKYPTIADYQVDIFYLGGYDNFVKYKEAGRLTRLDEELSGASKEIKKYVPAQFLDNMKSLNSGTYVLPTSKSIGEYTYLLLHKEALAAASRNFGDYSSYTSLTCADTKDFLQFVNSPASGLSDTFYPLYTDLDQQELLTNLYFWGVDEAGDLSDDFSVLGDYFNNSDNYLATNTYAEIANLFENEQFVSDLRTLKDYQVNGYYASAEDANKKFAVGYVQGGAELAEIYADEYEMIPVSYPRLDEDDLYSDMFAVCSYTSDTSRSMKVLTLLNTDEEFRNLILYGIEGEHYQWYDTGVENKLGETYKEVERLNNDYMMDVEKTGNVLLAYPMKGELATIKEYGVAQNLDAKVELGLGYTPDYNGFAVDTESLQAVRTLSAEIWAKYEACTTMEAFEAFLTEAKATVAASEAVQLHIDADHGTNDKGEEKSCDGKCGSMQCSYAAWLQKMKIKK